MKSSIKKLIVFLLVCSLQLPTQAQIYKEEIPKYTPLKVGDCVPDYKLINLINYSSKTANLSDLKGKLVILDFWNSHCISCIESWPNLLRLQKEFDESLQIILINPWEDYTLVKSIFAKILLYFSCFPTIVFRM